MSTTLEAGTSPFSPHWYRVAGLRPRLRSHIELKRQMQRGEFWYLLIDRAGERIQRLNRVAYQFVGRCDGTSTVEQIWNHLLNSMPDEAMTQEEVLRLLVQLHNRGALEFDVAPNVELMFRLHESSQKRARRGVNVLAFSLPLLDPSPVLDRMQRLGRRVFSTWGWWLWLSITLWGVVTAALHWQALSAHAHETMGTRHGLLVAWLIYPLIKLIHECAHGLAVHRFGGRVRSAGITLMMLTPVPFVNASAADGFRDRYHRILVSAAGIMAETLLAALALGIWLIVQPGLLRDLALSVMVIGGVSTVLVNGNPLMRFDGYYVLCDALDLRNLAARSGRYWVGMLNHRLLGMSQAPRLQPLPGERVWLILFAPLAWLYRLVLSVAIVLWMGGQSTALGLAVSAFVLWGFLIQPLWWSAMHLYRTVMQDTMRGRALVRPALLVATVVLLIGVLPLPFNTLAEGVVWLPEKAQLRVLADGFLVSFAVEDGARVKAGDLLVVMDDDRLEAERAGYTSDIVELESEMFEAMEKTPEKVGNIRQRLEYARAQVARVDQKISDLQIRAQVDGIVVMPHQQDMLGTFRKQGALLGYLLTSDPLTVRVALPQEDATLVRSNLDKVDVRLAEYGNAVRVGHVSLDVPAAVDRLPSEALGDRGGGRILTDASDKDGLKARSPIVLVDVAVPGLRADRIGGRALVRFNHGRLPLAAQTVRKLQQLVLHSFNPAT
jgi:putative peptide zinc metalloprotease protein